MAVANVDLWQTPTVATVKCSSLIRWLRGFSLPGSEGIGIGFVKLLPITAVGVEVLLRLGLVDFEDGRDLIHVLVIHSFLTSLFEKSQNGFLLLRREVRHDGFVAFHRELNFTHRVLVENRFDLFTG